MSDSRIIGPFKDEKDTARRVPFTVRSNWARQFSYYPKSRSPSRRGNRGMTNRYYEHPLVLPQLMQR